jgi:hypothetical protein
LHRRLGLAFLMQEDGGSNALELALDCPFEVVTDSPAIKCNHAIHLPRTQPAGWDRFMELTSDPLVEAMLPVPMARDEFQVPVFLDRTDVAVVSKLATMSSPIRPPIYPLWTQTPAKLRNQIWSTNVQPLVITNVLPTDAKILAQLFEVSRLAPRKLVLLGDQYVVLGDRARRIRSAVTLKDLDGLDLQRLGAFYLRQEMLSG